KKKKKKKKKITNETHMFDLASLHWTTGQDIRLYLPKFTYTFDKELGQLLRDKVGLKDAFDLSADFTGISKSAKSMKKGTTAAAVTAISVTITSLSTPKEVQFDHPFDFFIWDEQHQLMYLLNWLSFIFEWTDILFTLNNFILQKFGIFPTTTPTIIFTFLRKFFEKKLIKKKVALDKSL
ncbi:hypothetical protein RFI_28294, partial [Reticulomyxa filosa]